MFCPKCGSILLPKKDNTKRILACSCGYKDTNASHATTSETLERKKEVEVVDEDVEVYPITDAECEKCKHKKAYFWEIQTRASDEPATKFMKCVKCKHIWRDYN